MFGIQMIYQQVVIKTLVEDKFDRFSFGGVFLVCKKTCIDPLLVTEKQTNVTAILEARLMCPCSTIHRL